MFYSRFVTINPVYDNDFHYDGILCEVSELKKEKKLSKEELKKTNEVFLWFNKNYPCPPYKEKKFPKSALAWFKNKKCNKVAREKLAILWVILFNHGIKCKELRKKHIGKIIYEDDYQVVADYNYQYAKESIRYFTKTCGLEFIKKEIEKYSLGDKK